MDNDKLLNHRVTVLESDVLDIKDSLKEHDSRLDLHDIKFTEHTKDFERLNETIAKLDKTMKEFISELKKIKEEPIESSKYIKRVIISTVVTTSLGIILGIIFKEVI